MFEKKVCGVGNDRFQLISSDLLHISQVSIGFLGLFVSENILTILSQFLKSMKIYHAFV